MGGSCSWLVASQQTALHTPLKKGTECICNVKWQPLVLLFLCGLAAMLQHWRKVRLVLCCRQRCCCPVSGSGVNAVGHGAPHPGPPGPAGPLDTRGRIPQVQHQELIGVDSWLLRPTTWSWLLLWASGFCCSHYRQDQTSHDPKTAQWSPSHRQFISCR